MTSDRKKRRAAKRSEHRSSLLCESFFRDTCTRIFTTNTARRLERRKRFEETPAIRKSRQFDESGTLGARSWNKYRRRKSQKQCVNWDRHGGRRVLRIWIK
jgi:hypothetical protein